MANISIPFCLDIVSTAINVRITISRLDSKFVKVPHCLNHKCMWVWWMLSRQGSTWKYMEGRSIILYLSFSIVVEDKPLCKHRLQKELSQYHLCFKHEYTWVIKGDCVVLHSWMHKTRQVLCEHMQMGLVYLCEVHTWRKDSHPSYTVFQTWKHLRHQSWLCCASIMNTQDSLKLTLLCFKLEGIWLLKLTLHCFDHECTGSDISMCFNLNTHGLTD